MRASKQRRAVECSCGMVFLSLDDLVAHHDKAREHVCSNCGETFCCPAGPHCKRRKEELCGRCFV